MQVVNIGGNLKLGGIVNIVVLLAAGNNIHLAKQFGFLDGLVSPCACVEISSLGLEQVVGNHGKLSAGTTAQEKNLITFGNVEQLFEERLSFVHHSLELLAAVRDFQNRETHVVEITNGFNGIVNGILTQN